MLGLLAHVYTPAGVGQVKLYAVRPLTLLTNATQGWPRLAKAGQGWPRLAKAGQGWPRLAKAEHSPPTLHSLITNATLAEKLYAVGPLTLLTNATLTYHHRYTLGSILSLPTS